MHSDENKKNQFLTGKNNFPIKFVNEKFSKFS
jgi:hypothetical protein